MALAATIANTVKGRGASGKTTYLDRFVETLLDENGQPTAPKKRTLVIAEISLAICLEERAEALAAGTATQPFTLTKESNTEDDAMFKACNLKVKNQVAAAIANNQNSTSISYNEKYKDVWSVAKHADGMISLAPVTVE